MPWQVKNRGGKYVVVKEGTNNVVGTHNSANEAKQQVKALYANYNSPSALKKRGVSPDYKGAIARRRAKTNASLKKHPYPD